MSKQDITATAVSSHPVAPSFRIGDLVWCQEAKNNKLWWPAMVTYDPHLGIFYRTSKQKFLQYHVQYFGISAIRGWVSFKSCVALRDSKEKVFHTKGLSKKIKAEYAVAIQEVSEAAKLDYKQRKLKFIFSFGSSRRDRGKKVEPKTPKDIITAAAIPKVKVEPKDDIPPLSTVKQEVPEIPEVVASELNEGRTIRRKSSVSLVASGSSGSSDPLPDDARQLRRSSIRVKARRLSELSRSDDTTSETELGGVKQNSDTGTTMKEMPTPTVTTPTNGEWSGGIEETDRKEEKDATSPPCLHSTHALRPSTRRRSSNSDPLDCKQCLEYISNSEGLEMTCTSKPETFVDSSVEMNVEPILMYVQKQYGSSGSLAPSLKTNPSPNLNRNPLTRGVSTRNLSTNLSNPAKQLHHATTRSKVSESSLSPVPQSSNGSQSSESGYETGKNVPPLLSANRKRRKNSSVSSGPNTVVSPLTEMHSKQIADMKPGEEEATTRKRKRGKSSSSSQNVVEVGVSGTDEAHSGNEGDAAAAAPVKRFRKASAEYSKASTLVSGSVVNKSSSSQKKRMLDCISSSEPATNDSCSEMSVASTSLTTSILTPPSSGSEEATSVDFESDDLTTSRRQSSSMILKKMKQNTLLPDCKLNVCCICDCEGTDLLTCKGHCMNSFHLDCLGLMEEPSFKFVCDECLVSSGTCFVCGKGDGEVKKCNKPRCSKLYHLECIRDNKLFQFGKSLSSFTCPLHMCARCTSIGVSTVNHSNLLQCVRCPLALHKPDCLVAGCEVMDHNRMVCYQHLKITKNTNLYSHINLNTCLECGSIGSLYCCDICSAAYHLECLDVDSRPDSDTNHWRCPSCAVHDLPTYGSLVITKFGVWRWWPSEVVLPEDVPDNIVLKKPGDGMFVVRFCGSRDFCWTYHGRVLPYTEDAELEGMRGHKKPKASDNYKKACEEAKEINNTRRKVLEAKVAARQNSKSYTKIKANRYLVPRPPLDLESPDFLPCQCTPESPCKEDSTCVNRAIHIECNPKNCPVGDLCQNQRMQKCQNAKTDLVFTGNRGWGLKAATDLPAGEFVIEYVGEVLDEAMCRERLTKAHAQSYNNFYMLTLDAGLVIDAGRKSNHARFINHSCGPNCETQKWRVRGEQRIGIFTRQNVPAGSELTFDYHLDSLGNEKKKCFCGSKNCSGFLGLRSSKVVSEDEMKVKFKTKKKKKSKPRQPVQKEESAQEDRHDDECFICSDGGELLLCDRKACCRAYHLECISRKVFPPKSQKWECPWHFCTKCQKTADSFCSTCPVSFCSKHMKDQLSQLPESNVLICNSCSEQASEKHDHQSKPPCLVTQKSETSVCDEEVPSDKPASPAATAPVPRKKPASSKSSERKSSSERKKSFTPPQSVAKLLSPKAGLVAASGVPPESPSSTVTVERPHPALSPLVATMQARAEATSTPSASSVLKSSDLHAKSPSTGPSIGASEYHKEPDTPQVVQTPNSHLSRTPPTEPLRSPSAFRTCLNRTTPLFQPQSPTLGQNYPHDSHSANYADFGARAMAGFQQPPQQQPPQQQPQQQQHQQQQQQQTPLCNNFMSPVWFMSRNGLVNGLDAHAGTGGFAYPSYHSALINHAPLGFSYPPGYFGEPVPNLESFNLGMYQLPSSSSSSSSSSTPAIPSSTSFPVFPPMWKYC